MNREQDQLPPPRARCRRANRVELTVLSWGRLSAGEKNGRLRCTPLPQDLCVTVLPLSKLELPFAGVSLTTGEGSSNWPACSRGRSFFRIFARRERPSWPRTSRCTSSSAGSDTARRLPQSTTCKSRTRTTRKRPVCRLIQLHHQWCSKDPHGATMSLLKMAKLQNPRTTRYCAHVQWAMKDSNLRPPACRA
jgi:hypothetical protein